MIVISGNDGYQLVKKGKGVTIQYLAV